MLSAQNTRLDHVGADIRPQQPEPAREAKLLAPQPICDDAATGVAVLQALIFAEQRKAAR